MALARALGKTPSESMATPATVTPSFRAADRNPGNVRRSVNTQSPGRQRKSKTLKIADWLAGKMVSRSIERPGRRGVSHFAACSIPPARLPAAGSSVKRRILRGARSPQGLGRSGSRARPRQAAEGRSSTGRHRSISDVGAGDRRLDSETNVPCPTRPSMRPRPLASA